MACAISDAETRFGLFNEYIAVDWSAAATPRTGADSIWIAHRSRTWNPSTRSEACALIERLIERRRGRVLVGFDFSFGYPTGFATVIGARTWIDVWQEISRRVIDRDDNSNNRFEAAAKWNREISGRASPFWGCPPSAEGAYLSIRKTPLPEGIAEFRGCDLRVPGIQPAWKLYTTGSVGSQMLTGIPRLLRLRERIPNSAVWPFEPWRRAEVVFAEIYPSMIGLPARAAQPKDKAQVLAAVRWMARLDGSAFDIEFDPLEGAILGLGTNEIGALEGAPQRTRKDEN